MVCSRTGTCTVLGNVPIWEHTFFSKSKKLGALPLAYNALLVDINTDLVAYYLQNCRKYVARKKVNTNFELLSFSH
jgi:hypothetical protein